MGRKWKDAGLPKESFLKKLQANGMIYAGKNTTGKITWLIDGIVGVGWNMVICGITGIGKSVFAIDIAMHLLSGKPWLGHSVRQVKRILMFQRENPTDVMLERMHTAGQNFGLYPREVTKRLIVTDKNQHHYDLESPEDQKRIVKLASAHPEMG